MRAVFPYNDSINKKKSLIEIWKNIMCLTDISFLLNTFSEIKFYARPYMTYNC